jgi:hypothetical protein
VTVRPPNLEVDDALEWMLARDGRRITRLTRTAAPYSSSFRMEEVEVAFEDGGTAWFVLKDLSPGALLDGARRAKPPFLFDPRREIETYRHVLVPPRVPAPRVAGVVADEARERYLLLLERVPGVPLWQVGELEAWEEAARCAAGIHAALAEAATSLAAPARLLAYDEAYYRCWRGRAEAVVAAGKAEAASRVFRAYDLAVPDLLAMPRTFIHGEFHASNIVAAPSAGAFRVIPVDWEMAALAPRLMDLADLTAGNWTPAQRRHIAGAYRAAAAARGASAPRDFDRALDQCRLHRAVQWLGWSDDWLPPREHAQDWLGEALRLCDALGES